MAINDEGQWDKSPEVGQITVKKGGKRKEAYHIMSELGHRVIRSEDIQKKC